MSNYKTYFKQKWICFALSVIFYFVPFTVATACLLPIVSAAEGFKIAIGLGIVIINAIPFIMGVFRAFFAHFPMLNVLSFVFIALAAFFTLEVFKAYADKFLWIELAAALGSVISCIFWGQFLKYSDYRKSVKATIGCGAFTLKGD